jgi:hypothetical protein
MSRPMVLVLLGVTLILQYRVIAGLPLGSTAKDCGGGANSLGGAAYVGRIRRRI